MFSENYTQTKQIRSRVQIAFFSSEKKKISDQAARPISTGRLKALRLVHVQPINPGVFRGALGSFRSGRPYFWGGLGLDRKRKRLNSSHSQKSYSVFCLKKKKK